MNRGFLPTLLWRRFWFPAVPIARLAVFRILLCLYVVQDLLFESRFLLRYGSVASEFYDPILIIRTLGLPRLGETGAHAVYAVLLVACLLAMVGLATRVSLLVAAPLHLYWFANYHSYQWIYHARVATTMALLVLAFAPSGRAYSLDSWLVRRWRSRRCVGEQSELAGWAVQALTVFLALAYGFAGYTKLRVTGTDWWTGGAFESGLLRIGRPFAQELVVEHRWLIHGLALSILVFELCAPLLLIRTRIQRWYAGAAIVFHLGTFAMFRSAPTFLGWAVVCTIVFRLERIPAFLRARRRPSPRLQPEKAPAWPACASPAPSRWQRRAVPPPLLVRHPGRQHRM